MPTKKMDDKEWLKKEQSKPKNWISGAVKKPSSTTVKRAKTFAKIKK